MSLPLELSTCDALFLSYIVNAPRHLGSGAPHHLTPEQEAQRVVDSPAPAGPSGRWRTRAGLPIPRSEMAWATVARGRLHERVQATLFLQRLGDGRRHRVRQRAGLHGGETVGLCRSGLPAEAQHRDGDQRAERSAQHRLHG